MKTKQITVTVTRHLQTAPYENYQIEVAETMELEKNDKASKIRLNKIDELMKELDVKEKELRKKFKKKKEK